ncbi:hypothetical protein HED55_03330 [Ochrobactrum haematophilum]|uniref:Uncharacterized protein n=1 Tax=Brucella haematophila TaxID=419474 RepID=A0ABX1DJZ5_9HYPH|nr:hypothetical protein [Brucella haematophila]
MAMVSFKGSWAFAAPMANPPAIVAMVATEAAATIRFNTRIFSPLVYSGWFPDYFSGQPFVVQLQFKIEDYRSIDIPPAATNRWFSGGCAIIFRMFAAALQSEHDIPTTFHRKARWLA